MSNYKIDYDLYMCCDICNEIIGISFKCPICKEYNALNNDIDMDTTKKFYGLKDKSFGCEDCKSKFTITDLDSESMDISRLKI